MKNIFGQFQYLRELSVVIIGIAITFTASDLITRSNDQKKLERSMAALKTEMEENLYEFNYARKVYNQMAVLSDYLSTTDRDELSREAIDSPGRVPGSGDHVVTRLLTLTYKQSAFDMWLSSGMIHLMKDESLSRSILDSYAMFDDMKSSNESYMDRKWDILVSHMIKKGHREFDLLHPDYSEVLYFFEIHFNIESKFNQYIPQIEQTLARF